MRSATNHPSVAMLEQLGGQRFIAMTGAKDFMSGDDPLPRLIFRLPTTITKQRGSHFEIVLLPTDEYRLTFFKMRQGGRVFIAGRDNVQVGDLRRSFTDMTGLDTSL